ncbi:MAG: phosphomannomutase/phosphoglucomutase [Gammaproteobacteria bacterium]|nr:phosphomannomutase/phosphoglucomutase [Gammaproteobacteria bacterium]
MADIFKAYDIRGKVGADLNETVVKNIGKAFADWLPREGEVAVGYDMRPESQQFAEAISEGLIAQGYGVVNIGQVATDMLYYTVGRYNLAGGAMVTASHNPGEYNGIKLCHEGAQGVSLDSGLDVIRDAIATSSYKDPSKTGEVRELDVMDEWIDHVLSFINVRELTPFKIAIDTGNGMAGKVMPVIAARLPFDITPMYYELDGTFPNHPANPLEPKNVEDLIDTVRNKKLDLGIAFDADGDRMSLIDEKGRAVSGTIVTAMLAEYFLKEDPSNIIYNAICGQIVPKTIEENGGTGIRTRVGHSFIKQEMKKANALFGGEHSMHYYFRDNWFADSGLIAAVVALAALSETGWTLSQYADKYDKFVQIPETNFEVEDKQAVIDSVAEQFGDAEQDRLDGLTVHFATSWFNLRPSNTEPLLRLNAEAANQTELDSLVDKVRAAAGFEPIQRQK